MGKMTIEEMLPSDIKEVLILGHIKPDGDCVGSTMGLYHYLKTVRPDLSLHICLQPFDDSFRFLSDIDRVVMMSEMNLDQVFDLCISCDASDLKRLGDAARLFESAKHRITIDHHITNKGMAEQNYIRGGLSSCAEALCELIDFDQVNKACAECLYLGLVHDTGVFRFNTTTRATMDFAGALMEKGVDQNYIIDATYFARNYPKTRITGYAMEKAELYHDGKLIVSYVNNADLQKYGADSRDLSGIIDELRVCAGVEAALFIYELNDGKLKASMRSNGDVNVSVIASKYNGGGHVRAAGCESELPYEQFKSLLLKELEAQL